MRRSIPVTPVVRWSTPMAGWLIGINSAILTRSGGNQGIGFAVPSDLCRWVMDSLVKNGHVERGLLGVMI
jgi:serine protease Do